MYSVMLSLSKHVAAQPPSEFIEDIVARRFDELSVTERASTSSA
jgi:hypothetical protein